MIAFALELLPRTTRAQAMDVLSSQANLAGYRAVIDGLAEFDRVMPMLMTAAGTMPPAKVFVIGAGVAGLQAIATARRLGAVVSATDIRPAAKEEIESLGAKFVGVVKEDAATAGGYAKELSDEDRQQQAEMVAQAHRGPGPGDHHGADPGPPGAAAGEPRHGREHEGRARCWSISRSRAAATSRAARSARWSRSAASRSSATPTCPSRLAPATSSLYARNLLNFIDLLIDPDTKALVINEDDDLIKGTLITKDGKVVHPALSQNQAA